MRISELLSILQDKLVDYGDVEVKFAELNDIVVNSKLVEIYDVSVEDFEYGRNTVVLWDK